MKISHILGLNARSHLYLRPYNKRKGRRLADSKLRTKKVFASKNIPIPQLYATFEDPRQVLDFDWSSLPSSFVVKPDKGFGGEGIVIIKKRGKNQGEWVTTQKDIVTTQDLKLHVLDTLEGLYSLHNTPDNCFIEEFVGRHKSLKKYSFRGTPDIRVIVFNKVPVMAMLRLPTRESRGHANLQQGAIGVGIDIATGVTTWAIHHGEYIRYKPGTRRKLNGIKIPDWTKILKLSVLAQEASGLGMLGVDIVIHPEKGPMILEINARPGLKIQLANKAGLKKRLERVEDLQVRDATHGVRIAKALFASKFASRVKNDESSVKILNSVERIKVRSATGKHIPVMARIDTGAFRSSIDEKLARDLGLLTEDNILWRDRFEYRSASGVQPRPVIGLTMFIKGRKIRTSVSVADRSNMQYPMIIGRIDSNGFLVKP